MFKRISIRPRAQGRVSFPVDAVEHHAASAFQERVVRFKLSEIHNFREVKSMGMHQVVQDVLATFLATIGRKHGVQAYTSVRMETDPVVGKQGVGCVRCGVVLDHHDLHASGSQIFDHAVKLFQRRFMNVVHVRIALVVIVAGGFFVFAKRCGAHHEDVGSALGLVHTGVRLGQKRGLSFSVKGHGHTAKQTFHLGRFFHGCGVDVVAPSFELLVHPFE